MKGVARGLVLVCLLASWAAADPEARVAMDREWHAGFNLRPELGVHPVRVGGGVRFDRLDLDLVLDPLYVTDGVFDLDLLGEWRAGSGYSAILGWRWTAVALDTGHQFQERAVIGLGAALPTLFCGRVAPRLGLELAILIAKHGGGLPSEAVPFDRTFLGHFNAGVFLRVDYGHPF